jgi:hypothetical protein
MPKVGIMKLERCLLLGNGPVNTFPRRQKNVTTPLLKQKILGQQHVPVETVFSMCPPRRYITRLTGQLELSSGVGNWRNNGKKGIRLCKENFMMCCGYNQTVMNPLPGNG